MKISKGEQYSQQYYRREGIRTGERILLSKEYDHDRKKNME